MNEYYTLKQAMDQLVLRSFNSFRKLERKYPEVFVNICPYNKMHKFIIEVKVGKFTYEEI